MSTANDRTPRPAAPFVPASLHAPDAPHLSPDSIPAQKRRKSMTSRHRTNRHRPAFRLRCPPGNDLSHIAEGRLRKLGKDSINVDFLAQRLLRVRTPCTRMVMPARFHPPRNQL